MRDNTITARIDRLGSCRADPAYQYDYGLMLKFSGIDLPTAYEVHFGAGATSPTVTQIGGADGVNIPDSLLAAAGTIYAWIYLHTGESDGETVYTVTIPVLARGEITDEQPTPQEQGVIAQTIAALEAGVTTVQTIADGIPTEIETALAAAKASGEFDGPPGPQGERGPKGDTGERGPAGQNGIDGQPGQDGKNGQDGKDGQDGAPGADGYTPVRGTDYWTAEDQAAIVQDVLNALPTWTGGDY